MSSHYNERPAGANIDTIVIHAMYVPGSKERYDLRACAKCLEAAKVSAHYLVSRKGEVVVLVNDSARAWHAGVSRMPFPDDSREGVNDFSIGIELLGDPEKRFTRAQYRSLARLCAELVHRHPIRAIVGHDDIAPDRKVDPGENFNWSRFRRMLADRLGVARSARLRFPRKSD